MHALSLLSIPRYNGSPKSLAYWVGTLREPLPPRLNDPAKLKACMALHFDREEQARDEDHIRAGLYDIFDIFRPVAPVAVSEGWSPFPLALTLLGNPTSFGIKADAESGWPAFGVFQVPRLELAKVMARGPHEKHFARVIQFAVEAAKDSSLRELLIVAAPGWSFRDVRRMPKQARQVMCFAGYREQERRVWPWWRIW